MGWTYHQLATNHQTETFELRYAVFKHIFVDLLLFWLLPWGKHLLQVYPRTKRCFKTGEQFLALSPMPAGPHKWIKSFRTQLFVVQKVLFFRPAFDSRKKRSIPRTGVVTPKNRTVLDPTPWLWFHGCCVGEWCWWPWRRSVTKVSLWVAGGKGWGLVCVLTNVAFTLW